MWQKQFLRLSDSHLPNIFISAPEKAVQIHINKKAVTNPDDETPVWVPTVASGDHESILDIVKNALEKLPAHSPLPLLPSGEVNCDTAIMLPPPGLVKVGQHRPDPGIPARWRRDFTFWLSIGKESSGFYQRCGFHRWEEASQYGLTR